MVKEAMAMSPQPGKHSLIYACSALTFYCSSSWGLLGVCTSIDGVTKYKWNLIPVVCSWIRNAMNKYYNKVVLSCLEFGENVLHWITQIKYSAPNQHQIPAYVMRTSLLKMGHSVEDEIQLKKCGTNTHFNNCKPQMDNKILRMCKKFGFFFSRLLFNFNVCYRNF